jgi:hypothetical protein
VATAGGVTAEPRLAFCVDRHEPPALEVRVNFGVFAGRQATPAEIDDLARYLLDEVGTVTIVAEERHEVDPTLETSVHMVRVEVSGGQLPTNDFERRRLERALVERADHWARQCIAQRHAPGLVD